MQNGENNNLAGAVGAFLGACVGAIPMLIVGLFGYTAGWLLGCLVVFASFKGYQLLGGPKKEAYAFGVIRAFSIIMMAAVPVIVYIIYGVYIGFILQKTRYIIVYLIQIVISYFFGMYFCRPRIKLYTQPERMQDVVNMDVAEKTQQQHCGWYPSQRGWMRSLRASVILCFLPTFFLAIVMSFFAIWQENYLWIFAVAGCMFGVYISFFPTLFFIHLLQADFWLFAQWEDGTFWRVSLARLNKMDTYEFTAQSGLFRGICWWWLNAEEQARAKESIMRAMAQIKSGTTLLQGSLRKVVVPLTDLQVKKENKWGWKVTYRLDSGNRANMTIPKAYKNLQFVPGAASPQGPVPFRWGICITMWSITLFLAVIGGYIGSIIVQ